ncbi:MAG: glutaminase domain-containing protein [Sphingobacterium sp.]
MNEPIKLKMLGVLIFLCLISASAASAQQRKAPAYPLITHNPNFSIWSYTDELNQSATTHWTDADHSLLGLIQVDDQVYRFLGEEEPNYQSILSTSQEGDYSVSYTEQKPGEDWTSLDYPTTGWQSGKAPIGDQQLSNTRWESDDIWVRRTFEVRDLKQINELFLKLNHDDNIDVFLNGERVYQKTGWTSSFDYIPLDKNALRSGENIIAIHLANTAGGRFLDFGLVNKLADSSQQNLLAKQTNVEVTATRTIYNFTAGSVDLEVVFTSPLLMDDLEVLARPVSYITYRVKSNDDQSHAVNVFFAASSNIAVYQPAQEVTTEHYETDELSILKTGTVEQPILEKGADDMRIDWGYFYVATPKTTGATQFITKGADAADAFRTASTQSTASTGRSLSLNTIIPFGNVGQQTVEQFVTLGYDERISIQYFGEDLRPWWNHSGDQTIEGQLTQAVDDYPSIIQRSEALDQQIYEDALRAGGKEYAHLCLLAYRQSIAAHTLVKSPKGETLWLSKENNSGGFINTVDVTYPSAPLYLLYNPELLQGMLTGIFYFSESGKYPHPWAAHDLGTYPKANGQTYGEPMPVEESGNMIILTAAISRVEGHTEYAEKHWETLTTWANYLVEEGLDPKEQLCTDDFAGHLARNANLSIKAIVGIACYAQMAEQKGDLEVAKKYRAIAEGMVPKWIEMADAGDHFALTFDDKNTWSQKYNLIWDKVLDLNLFPQEVYDTEINYYMTKGNKYGLPLDSRKAYTKNDWIVWTASFAPEQEQFLALIKPLYRHVLEGPSRVPLNDFYDSITGVRENFKARSVVGGFYMKMLADRLKTE